MPAVQYPFIDIAVHERVRDHFGRGEAMVLFSTDMSAALWANGRGASLFGVPVIYDFLDRGPKRNDVTFRQLSVAASRLNNSGDTQQFTIRIHAGFKSIPVVATVEIIEIEPGQAAVLFTTPLDASQPSVEECARRMIEGFDDPDIHLAVVDERNGIIAASSGFNNLEMTSHTARTLVTMAANQPGHLVKRPVPTGKGYLPAAAAKLSTSPDLNLLFVVETVLGRLDPTEEPTPKTVAAPVVETVLDQTDTSNEATETDGFDAVIDAVAALEEPQVEPDLFETEDAIIQPVETAVDLPDEVLVEEIEIGEEALDEDVPPAEAAALDLTDDGSDAIETDAHDDELAVEIVSDVALEQDAEVPAVSSIQPAAPDEEQSKATEEFVFNPSGRASRFVWKIDAKGRFSSISHEFADTVGPRAADVDGLGFSDVAQRFNLDPDGKITELLGKRDTWSGKTIYWPVEGTSLSVPIDLAALPTYTRTREFDGFRGFGIVRLADAIEDPNAIGLSFASAIDPLEEPAQDDTAELAEDALTIDESPDQLDASAGDEQVSADSSQDTPDGTDEAEIASSAAIVDDANPRSYEPPVHEVPALEISETPNRRYSDKVIQLEDRRVRGRDGLSPNEQAAFREIARQLTPADIEASERDFQAEKTEPAYVAAGDDLAPAEMSEIDDQAEATDQMTPVADTETADVADSETAPHEDVEEDAFADYVRKPEAAAFEAPKAVEAEVSEPADDADTQFAETQTAAEPVTTTGIVTPRTRMTGTLTPQAIDIMPVALLVHTGSTLLHANPEFLRLTGYASTQELSEVGGLDALLQRDELENMPGRTGGMVAVSAENDLIPVKARLQSIRWEGSTALMLALIPVIEAQPQPTIVEAAPEQDNTATTELTALQGEIEELHSILETATDGVVLLSEDGDIRSLNRSANALFNYDNAEIEGKPFVTLFAHESQKAILDYLSGLSNNGVASVLNDGREVIGREASGGFLPLFMTIGRLKSSNGYCAVIRDITQWKRTEDDLRNAKRAAETANAHKSDFLARVSHEIRTPLNAIIGFSDMMATERFGPIGHPRYVEYANDIGRSGRHVLDIVNDLLDISKIEAGQMDVDFAAVPLNETVAEAVSLVQPQANNQRVIIRTALSQSVPQIVADLRSIKQIVLNILSNAIRFTPSGGQIVVSTAYEANGSVVLRIRDTGIGMTRSELEQAMKPFRQVAAASSRVRGDGTGLGLPLTKAMVDANRANFSINSAPNEGTLVEISFPSQRVLAD